MVKLTAYLRVPEIDGVSKWRAATWWEDRLAEWLEDFGAECESVEADEDQDG